MAVFLYSIETAAKALSLSLKNLQKITHPNGTLRSIKIGRRTYYTPNDLKRWVIEQSEAQRRREGEEIAKRGKRTADLETERLVHEEENEIFIEEKSRNDVAAVDVNQVSPQEVNVQSVEFFDKIGKTKIDER